MKKFNLSDWALKHRSLIWFFMLSFALAGIFTYTNLGREEDPSFTIKTMVIQARWPGASAQEVSQQVTERIEKKLQDLDNLERTRSMTENGTTTIFVDLLPTTPKEDVKPTWQRVRNLISDIQQDFPQGIVGPFYNDQFGDVYGNVFALTSPHLSNRQLRDIAETARNDIVSLPDTGKVEIAGAQDEVIFLEFSTQKLAALGLDRNAVIESIRAQNAITQSGFISTDQERMAVRVTGRFMSEESLKHINLHVNNRFFPLQDIAEIKRGYVDPPSSVFRVDGKNAVGLVIGMKTGRNIIQFGKELDGRIAEIRAGLPAGVSLERVSDQPALVDEAVSGFTRALMEAVIIVLVISFISLGVRAGMVVAVAIPLVLAVTFVVMFYGGISLQRISLGALIIALGLLVDDAMIAVEMMVARLEAGDNIRQAATHVYTSTAFPMLTGTLITICGFLPVGFNSSNAGEFTFSLFIVLGVSLAASWLVAVLFTPLLGVTILNPDKVRPPEHKGWFSKCFTRVLSGCLVHKWKTIIVTLVFFLLSLAGYGLVQHQFFPNSDRTELIVDWNLPHNSSFYETSRQMARFEKEKLAGNPDIVRWSTYVGTSAPRFILSFNVQPDMVSYGQTVIVTKDIAARDRLKKDLQDYLYKTFPGTDAYVSLLEIGPPVGKPVQYRLSGPDIDVLKERSKELQAILDTHPSLSNVAADWGEPARKLKINVIQDKARQLGVSSEDIATAMNDIVEGTTVTQVLDNIYLVDVMGRASMKDRDSIDSIINLQLPNSGGGSIPLSAIANFSYELEQPVIWRWNKIPTITIKAAIKDGTQPATITDQLKGKMSEFRSHLPAGYTLTVGGTVEESAKSEGPIMQVVPVMLFIITMLLMFQLQSFSRMFIVFSVAPLALVGVVAALLITGKPLGFVALLGILALTGILIRNSVILIVQIETLIASGTPAWQAVVEATEHRMRPIMLTAAAATLGLIPIAREIFWGPMSVAMMGGIIWGTVVTLLFLPALYIVWFRIEAPERE